MGIISKLSDMLTPSKPAVLGSGMANKAGQAIQGRAYQLYLAECQSEGNTPVSPEDFAAGKR